MTRKTILLRQVQICDILYRSIWFTMTLPALRAFQKSYKDVNFVNDVKAIKHLHNDDKFPYHKINYSFIIIQCEVQKGKTSWKNLLYFTITFIYLCISNNNTLYSESYCLGWLDLYLTMGNYIENFNTAKINKSSWLLMNVTFWIVPQKEDNNTK